MPTNVIYERLWKWQSKYSDMPYICFRHVIHMQTEAATFLIVFAHGKMSTAFASRYPG